MPVSVALTNTANLGITEYVERDLRDVEGCWTATISGAPNTSAWVLKLDGPGGFCVFR